MGGAPTPKWDPLGFDPQSCGCLAVPVCPVLLHHLAAMLRGVLGETLRGAPAAAFHRQQPVTSQVLAASEEATDGVSPRERCTCKTCGVSRQFLSRNAIVQEMKQKWADSWQAAETTYAGSWFPVA